MTGETSSDVSVIICCHDPERWPLLTEAVASVRRQSVAAELIVVCDGDELLLRRCERELDADVVLWTGAHASGLSGARNLGVDAATGQVIAFLDDDALAADGWLHALRGHLDRSASIGAVGGTANAHWDEGRPTWFSASMDWTVGCTHRGYPAHPGPVRNVVGCNMAFRASALAAVGAFDPALGRVGSNGAGGEETELCLRLAAAGYEVHFVPEAVVTHHVPSRRASIRYLLRRCLAEGRSKATMRHLTPAPIDDESNYVRQVLLPEVLRDLLRRPGRAVATSAAVVAAGVGYARGRLREPRRFSPIAVLETERHEVTQALDAVDGAVYRSARCLIRDGDAVSEVQELTVAGPPVAASLLTSVPPLSESADGTPALALTVVIATTGDRDSLESTLDSLAGGTHLPEQVIVVENCTATPQLSPTSLGHAVDLLHDPAPGLARAHNTAMPLVRNPLVAFIDDDVVVGRSWVARVAAAFEDPEVGCVTGLVTAQRLETAAEYWAESSIGHSKGLTGRRFDAADLAGAGAFFPGTFGTGANMSFRLETLEQMGGFDEALGAGTAAKGGDDLAAFVDALELGWVVTYEPNAVVWHRHHPSLRALRRQRFSYGVGYGAYVARVLRRNPARGRALLRSLPMGLRHVTARRSDAVDEPVVPQPASPRHLELLNLAGMAMGPVAYRRARQRVAS